MQTWWGSIIRLCGKYRPNRPDDAALRQRLRELAQERRRFGYRGLGHLKVPEGHSMNHKKLYRIYREEGLIVRRCGSRKRALGTRAPMELLHAINRSWSLELVSDTLSDGHRFRILYIVDDFSRECLVTVVGTSLRGVRAVRDVERLTFERAAPKVSVSDHGTKLTRVAVLECATDRVAWHYVQPGKPVQGAFIEIFNSKLRDEWLNEHVLMSLAEAREIIEAWRHDYNHLRPHSNLRSRAPIELGDQHGNGRLVQVMDSAARPLASPPHQRPKLNQL